MRDLQDYNYKENLCAKCNVIEVRQFTARDLAESQSIEVVIESQAVGKELIIDAQLVRQANTRRD